MLGRRTRRRMNISSIAFDDRRNVNFFVMFTPAVSALLMTCSVMQACGWWIMISLHSLSHFLQHLTPEIDLRAGRCCCFRHQWWFHLISGDASSYFFSRKMQLSNISMVLVCTRIGNVWCREYHSMSCCWLCFPLTRTDSSFSKQYNVVAQRIN